MPKSTYLRNVLNFQDSQDLIQWQSAKTSKSMSKYSWSNIAWDRCVAKELTQQSEFKKKKSLARTHAKTMLVEKAQLSFYGQIGFSFSPRGLYFHVTANHMVTWQPWILWCIHEIVKSDLFGKVSSVWKGHVFWQIWPDVPRIFPGVYIILQHSIFHSCRWTLAMAVGSQARLDPGISRGRCMEILAVGCHWLPTIIRPKYIQPWIPCKEVETSLGQVSTVIPSIYVCINIFFPFHFVSVSHNFNKVIQSPYVVSVQDYNQF